MPDVPRFGAREMFTEPLRAPLSGAPQDVTQGLRQGVNNLASQLYAQREKERQRTNTIRATDADTQFQRSLNSLFYEGDQAYFNRQGQDAFDGQEAVLEQIEKLRSEYADGLDNDEQREAFGRAAEARVTRAMSGIFQHATAQKNAWEKSVSLARIENAIESGSYDYRDDNLSLNRELGRAEVIAIHKGAAPEVVQEALENFDSKLYTSAISRALATRDLAAAESIRREHGDRIEPQDLDRLDQAIAADKLKGESQRAADSIMASADALDDRLAAARKIKDPDLRDEVTRRVTNSHNAERAAREEAERETYESWGAQVQAGAALYSEIPAEALASMTVAQRGNLQSIEAARLNGDRVVTDWGTWTEVTLMPEAELARVNPIDYRGRLADTEYKKLVDLVKEARGPEDSVKLTQVRSVSSKLSNALQSINVDPKDKKGVAFTEIMQRRLSEFEEQKGGKATPTEVDELLNLLMIEVQVEGKGWLWGSGPMRVFELGPDDVIEVPDAERAKIVEALKRKNMPVTDSAIAELWVRKQARG